MNHRGAIAAILVSSSAVLLGSSAKADEGARTPREPLRGFGELDAALGFSAGPLVNGTALVPGLGFEFGVGPRFLPVTLGLGAGVWFLNGTTSPGPAVLELSDDGLSLGSSDITRTTELRHAEVILRIEPDWHWVRPFASVSFGAIALFQTESQDGATTETQQDVAVLRGFSAGCDIEPWGRRTYGTDGTGAFALTVGVRSLQTGDLEYLPEGAGRETGGPWRVVAPFVALTISGWS